MLICRTAAGSSIGIHHGMPWAGVLHGRVVVGSASAAMVVLYFLPLFYCSGDNDDGVRGASLGQGGMIQNWRSHLVRSLRRIHVKKGAGCHDPVPALSA
jgi:hypothetical protein